MTLQEAVKQVLEQRFWLSETGITEAEHRFCLCDLLREEEMDRFIRLYTETLRGSHIDVGGMYLVTWFSQVCSALHYTVSCHHTALHLSLDRIEIQLRPRPDGPVLAFRTPSFSITPCPEAHREEWIEAFFQTWYLEQVKPFLTAVARSSGIPAAQLWAQLTTRLYHAMDFILEETKDEATRAQIESDFDILVHRIGPKIFEGRKNLFNLKFKMVEYPVYPDRLFRVKAACCLYYKTEKACGDYCFTCPKISDEDREEKKRKLLAGTH